MKEKFHINNKGEVRRCTASIRSCKYGNHFQTESEAQKYVELQLNNEFELLPEVLEKDSDPISKLYSLDKVGSLLKGFEKSTSKKDYSKRKYLVDKALEIRENMPNPTWYSSKPESKADQYKINARRKSFESNKRTYYNRMRWAKRISSIEENTGELSRTYHYEVERKDKREQMKDFFNEGEVIGNYKINHTLETRKFLRGKPVDYNTQIVEVRDNGRCVVYDTHGNVVTTFLANHSRIEAYMIKANEKPNKEFLDTIKANKTIAVLLEIEK